LFSDVGDYYARFGWKAVPAFEQVLPAMRAQSEATMLTAGEVDAAWNDVEVPRLEFVVWPSAAQLDWHRERERAYAQLFAKRPLRFAGARADSGMIAWAADFKNDKLVVLHFDGGEALVSAAQHQAWEAGLGSVVFWEGDFAEKKIRTDSLPMVLPIREGTERWSFVPRGLWI
jgi:hypothetical protein